MSNYIKHHGIKGQKWGVRRFQSKDGDLTAAGKKRYDSKTAKKQTAKKQTAKKQTAKKQTANEFLKSVGKIAVTSYVNDKVRNGNGEEYASMFFAGVMSNGNILKLDDDLQGY